MRDIAMVVKMGDEHIVTLYLSVTEAIAERMQKNEKIDFKIMISNKEDENKS